MVTFPRGVRVQKQCENRTVTRVRELNVCRARQYEPLSTKLPKTRSCQERVSLRLKGRRVYFSSGRARLTFPELRQGENGCSVSRWPVTMTTGRNLRVLSLSACPLLPPVATALIIPARRELSERDTCSSRVVSIFRRWLLSAAISIPQGDVGFNARRASCTAKIVEQLIGASTDRAEDADTRQSTQV